MASISPLDSQRFGVVVARADGVSAKDLPALLSFCEQHDVELLIARCEGTDKAAAQSLADAGMVLLEAQRTYRGPIVPTTPAPDIREAVAEDSATIEELARSGFGDMAGHYHADPRLAADACRDAYVDWALRGLAGEAADVFYVAEVDGLTAGFGMFTQSGDEVRVQLATVAPWARGRGIYVDFLHRGMAWGSGRGANHLTGVTPFDNIPAQRSFTKAGMRPVASTSTFHGWRDQLAAAR